MQALEGKAQSLGIEKGSLYYLFPQNRGVNDADAPKAKALGLRDHLVADEHTGAQGGIGAAVKLFASNNTADWGSINLETNCGDHTHQRALEEGADLNQFFNFGDPRVKGRAASFCMERSGYNEAGLNDQGLIFFLPNMTWGQPPFYVHKLIKDTWQPNAVNFSLAGTGCGRVDRVHGAEQVSAQASDNGKSIVVRYVNKGAAPANITIQFPSTITGADTSSGPTTGDTSIYTTTATTAISILSWPDLAAANTPAEPTKISPKPAAAAHCPGSFDAVADACRLDEGGALQLTVPEQAYVVVTVTRDV